MNVANGVLAEQMELDEWMNQLVAKVACSLHYSCNACFHVCVQRMGKDFFIFYIHNILYA